MALGLRIGHNRTVGMMTPNPGSSIECFQFEVNLDGEKVNSGSCALEGRGATVFSHRLELSLQNLLTLFVMCSHQFFEMADTEFPSEKLIIMDLSGGSSNDIDDVSFCLRILLL